MDQYQCSTCNHVGSVYAIACGNWQTCRNFAKAKAGGALPNPFPTIGGGPTEADRT